MNSQANHVNKTRVQLDLAPAEVERMNWMMQACDLDTRKDLFNNSLTLLAWAVGEVVKGRKIASFDDNTKERNIVAMPVLQNAEHKRYGIEKKFLETSS